MVQPLADTSLEMIYPDSDGKPMADNTEQFRWIVTIKENLEILFAAQDDVFVAGNSKIRQAPDVMVVFGRPKGKRGYYKQWEENNIPPQESYLKSYLLAIVLEKWQINYFFINVTEWRNITSTIPTL